MSEVSIGILQQRRIEAGVIKPMVAAFEQELGHEKTKEILARVVTQLAQEKGQEIRLTVPDDTMTSFAETWEPWLRDDALQIDMLTLNPEQFHFNVTRCRYAEMYRDLGLTDLGYTLSCNRDASLIEGFSDRYTLTRTQTIMEGAAYCDFRYNRK
jgi:hypothetical protein